MSREVVIFGCGGHAVSVADVLLSRSPGAKLTFVDDNARENEKLFGFEVIKFLPSEEYASKECFVAMGDNEKRQALSRNLGQSALIRIVSFSANLRRDVRIGRGVFVANEAYIGPLSDIGEGAIVNTGAQLDHEVELEPYSQIAPAAVIGGRTHIGERAFVGIGARVIDGIDIHSDVIIGASATVVDDITEPGTYVGTPARKISG